MRNICSIWFVLLSASLTTGCGHGGKSPTSSSWTPPSNPNPQEILYQARADIKDGDYTNALTKLVWFHENALKINSSLAGVRLSYALDDWTNLAVAHPLALEKLKALRDVAAERVRNETGRDAYEAFMDFDAINETLNEDEKTKELFVWLDTNKPDTAKDLFNLAEPALIKLKEYKLCGKYTDAEVQYAAALKSFHMTSEIAKDPKHGKRLQDFADRKLKNEISTLIAVLVLNDRKVEATGIQDKLLKEVGLPEFKNEVEKALSGGLPTPWP